MCMKVYLCIWCVCVLPQKGSTETFMATGRTASFDQGNL